MENKKIEKKLEQRLPEGTFATCSYARLSDKYCMKYGNYPAMKFDEAHWQYYCLGDGNCDKFFS